jgi:hypothetical protein
LTRVLEDGTLGKLGAEILAAIDACEARLRELPDVFVQWDRERAP